MKALINKEEAISIAKDASGSFKVSLSMAVTRNESAFKRWLALVFAKVYEEGWSFDKDGVWRKIEEVGDHRDIQEMILLFYESIFVRRDKQVSKTMEAKVKELIPEVERVKMFLEVLYEHGGGIDSSGNVFAPWLGD